MVGFNDLIYRMQQWGLYDSILPFFLIFVVAFAVLQKSDILKDKRYNVVVSVILGLLVVIPHIIGRYPANGDVVVIMNAALPNVALVLVVLLAVFLIVGLFGGKATWAGKATGWVALLAFILVLFIFGRAANWFQTTPTWLRWIDDPNTQALVIIFAVFALVIWFITKEPSTEESGAGKALGKVGEELGKLFGKNE